MPAERTLSGDLIVDDRTSGKEVGEQRVFYPSRLAQVVHRPLARILIFAILGLTCLNLGTTQAALTDSQKRMTNNLKSAIDRAADLYKQQKFTDAARELQRAQNILKKLSETPTTDVIKEIKKPYGRMKKAHELLAAKGQSLDPLAELPAAVAAPTKKKSTDDDESSESGDEESDEDASEESEEQEAEQEADERSERTANRRASEKKSASKEKKSASSRSNKKSSKAQETETETVSFTRDVAPILVEHCGRCHVENNRGDYSLASYQTLMDGTSVEPNSPDTSHLLQMIESGEMPPKRGGQGRPVPEDEVQKIRDWISQGAKFDGEEAETNLQEL